MLRSLADIKAWKGSDRVKISLPSSKIRELAKKDLVKKLAPSKPPVVTLNDEAISLIEIDRLRSDEPDLTGDGFTTAIWDGGWAARHEDLNKSWKLIRGDSGCSETYCSVSDHATHVAGTMAGLGELQGQYEGVAPDSRIVTYEWPTSSSSELFHETNESINAYNSIVSQNSWGYSIDSDHKYLMGDYTGFSRDYDEIISKTTSEVEGTLPVVFAAGNEGGEWSFRYNTTTGPGATAKNTITVGAVDDTGDMTSYSSWGPTDDGRIKPDLVADGGCGGGSGITSTLPGNDYGSKCGTSMAAPAVSGTVALLTQKFNRTFGEKPEPATVKGILIQTAEDLGREGPDYKYGWGLVNASSASGFVENSGEQDLIKRDSLTQGETATYEIDVPVNESVKATLVWSDYPASTSASKTLVNDLDLVVRDAKGNRHYPWTLNWSTRNQTASRDREDHTNNLEQVYIPETTSNQLNITVEGDSIPQDPQEYSLILTEEKDKIPPEISIESPENKTYGETPLFNITAEKNLTEAVLSLNNRSNSSLKKENNRSFFNDSVQLASGSHEAMFYAENVFSIWGKRRVEFTVDKDKPEIDPVRPKNNSNISERIFLEAKWSDNTTEVVEHNYQLTGPEKISGTLNGSIKATEIKDGEYRAVFNVSDSAENRNNSSRYITVDTVSPVINVISPENSYVSGNIEINASASENTTAVESLLYELRNTSLQVREDLNSTLNSSELADGNYTLRYLSNDSAGNERTIENKIKIDNTPPEIEIERPENKTIKGELLLNASWNDTSGLEYFNYSLKGGETVETGNLNESINTTIKLPDGNYTLNYTARDPAGNMNYLEKNISIQNPPVLNISAPEKDTYNSSPSVNFSADENLETAKLNIAEENITLSNSSQKRFYVEDLNIPAGSYRPTLYAEDLQGNLRSRSLDFSFDNSSPESLNVTLDSEPEYGEWFRQNASVDAACSDSITGVEKIEIIQNGSTINETDSSNTSFNLKKNGKKEYRFICRDSASNKREETVEIAIDSRSPSLTGLTPGNNSEIKTGSLIAVNFSNESSGSGLNISGSRISTENGEVSEPIWSNSSVRFNTTSLDKGDKVKIDGYLEDNTGNVDSFRLSFNTPDPNPDTDSGGDEGDSSGGGGLISPSSLDSEESGENKSSGKEKNGTVNDSTSSVEVSDSKNIEREKTVVERIETNKEAEISISETEESHKPPERTEKYSELNISKKTGEEIEMNLTFSVNQSWFNRENLRAESTALYRQNNSEWQKLPTKLLNETQETYIFESEVPGFSVFLIAAENQTGQNRRISENTGNNSQKNTTSMKTSWPGEESFQNLRQILLSILLISIPLIGYELSEIKERREIVEELEELKEKTSENRMKTKLIQAEISLREDGIEEARERLSEIKEQTGKNGQR